jgi:hypothetical protein
MQTANLKPGEYFNGRPLEEEYFDKVSPYRIDRLEKSYAYDESQTSSRTNKLVSFMNSCMPLKTFGRGK